MWHTDLSHIKKRVATERWDKYVLTVTIGQPEKSETGTTQIILASRQLPPPPGVPSMSEDLFEMNHEGSVGF